MTGIGRLFIFGAQAQSKNGADILHNRKACFALQGDWGLATNKQRAKSKTFALLATIHPSKKIFPSDVTFPFKTASRYQLW